ncbi:MAG: hypothetical protein KOO62_10655 [candidate division Zixibacteria bacterium]|nr:hypothetical protein [candidate division Zixibacteria bacterium]
MSTLVSASAPSVAFAVHNRGNIELAIANNGTFGTEGRGVADPFTGFEIQSCEYPKNTDLVYLWVASMWIGAIVGRDTLVSIGMDDYYETRELWPDVGGFEPFTYSSIDINSPFYDPDAYSEQDITCEYSDTYADPAFVQSDPVDGRSHIPLGVRIYQRSMSWSFSYADDFILFDYRVQNIGTKNLEDVYLGIYVDGDVWHLINRGAPGWTDDIVGFYPTHPSPKCEGSLDTINVAFHADNDGDPEDGMWNAKSTRSAVGVRVVRTPSKELEYSFNWWITGYTNPQYDFGPRQSETDEEPYRNFGLMFGTPQGDRNKYYVMRREEFDYDLMYTAVDHSRIGWFPKPEYADDFADGYDCRYLLSFGPFNISPGQSLPVSFAWVGGEDFHQRPDDFERLWSPSQPHIYYNALNFDKLAANSLWASWVYDNPGIDTDGDGYFGEKRICARDSAIYNIDTITVDPIQLDTLWEITAADLQWTKGDGVPDFRGAGPPPAPRMRVIPGQSQLTIRWNGYYSETTPDFFLGEVDFEGYRVYISRDDRPGSFSVLTSYDRENYNRYRLRESTSGQLEWVLEDIPFTIDSLRILFQDPEFDPLAYSRTNPYTHSGNFYYFEAQDFNQSYLDLIGTIRKVYPYASEPHSNPEMWSESELVDDYGEPLPKYYEYEYVIGNLLPTVPYYCAVTSFDFGSPAVELPALESKPINNMVVEYPQLGAGHLSAGDSVYVYPNPYRIDADYRHMGFEGRGVLDKPDYRLREIHFANLPHKCKISIFSLDGDLVREIDHEVPPGDPQSAHDSWDLVTRNTQAVVSGMYYFVVESDKKYQIGKIVIIE